MAVYGYLRVSTKEQNSQYQKDMMLNYANENNYVPVTFIDETMSGAKSYKNRKLGSLINKLSSGDILLANEFSRLHGISQQQKMECQLKLFSKR